MSPFDIARMQFSHEAIVLFHSAVCRLVARPLSTSERLRFGLPKVSLYSSFSDFPCEEFSCKTPTYSPPQGFSTA